MNKAEENNNFLECERWWIFALLMMVSGYYGIFTYYVRGGIFCNAQTANFILLAINLANMNWSKALYYLIPMSAYLLGAMISESFAFKVKIYNKFRWHTILVGIEIIVVLILGFLPESAPFQISQVAIFFISSMRFNTFRQAQKIPMATTFCTNHVRQTGIHFVKYIRTNKEISYLKRSLFHLGMISMFVVGGIISVVLCKIFLGKAIWGAGALLAIVFADLLHADLTKEKELLDRKPAGH